MTVDDSGRYSPATLYSKVHGAVRAKLEQAKAEADAAHHRALNTLQNELETMRDQLKEERDRRLVAESSLMENSNKLFQLESRLRDADEHEEYARNRSRVTEELERCDAPETVTKLWRTPMLCLTPHSVDVVGTARGTRSPCLRSSLASRMRTRSAR